MKANLNQELNKETVSLLFQENKPYLAPALAILASILLFLLFLLPQFFSLSQKRNNANAEKQQLGELVSARDIASSADLSQLASNLSLANSVLPSSKNFENVINSLSTAAAQSDVVLQAYQFQDSAGAPGTQLQNFPALTFSVDLLASPDQTTAFIKELYQKAPLAEVESIIQNENSATLSIAFFYKPFSPVTDNSNIQIRKMNSSETNALNTISGWDITTFELGNFPEATDSAQENGSPF